MHASRAFLTDLSCRQVFRLKRRYFSNPPLHVFPLSQSLHCIDSVQHFPIVFVVFCTGAGWCWLEQSSCPVRSGAIVLALHPCCISKPPSYRCYLVRVTLGRQQQSCVFACTSFLNIYASPRVCAAVLLRVVTAAPEPHLLCVHCAINRTPSWRLKSRSAFIPHNVTSSSSFHLTVRLCSPSDSVTCKLAAGVFVIGIAEDFLKNPCFPLFYNT